MADDFVKDIDTQLKTISRKGDVVNDALGNPVTASKVLSDFLDSGKDTIRKSRIIFEGFGKKNVKVFKDSLKKFLGVLQRGHERQHH